MARMEVLALASAVLGAGLVVTANSSAQESQRPPEPVNPPAPASSGGAATVPAAPQPEPAQPISKEQVVPSKAPERKSSLEPKLAQPAPTGRTTFDIDPIADSAMIAVSLGFAGTLELVNSTGEIRPQQIAAGFDSSHLIAIDRPAATRKPDPHASGYSTIGLGAAVAFAFIDPVLSGVREHSVQTGLADAFMYSEALSFTLAMTNLVKMAVRRPRPIAYLDAEAHRGDMTYTNTSTDSALSFFSGHSAMTATVSATATYLAFARDPHGARPWITLAVGTGLTTFVSVERVRAGRHFPTDVIAGAIAGAGIGLVVPHLHRTEDIKQRRIWVGFTPLGEGARGGVLNVSGVF